MDSIIIRLWFTIFGVRIMNGGGPVQLVSLKIKIPFPSLEPWYILWQLENFKDKKPHKKNTYNSNLGIISASETNGLTVALELQEQMALTLSNWSSTESYNSSAWAQNFYNGTQNPSFKDLDGTSVRAVRAFYYLSI